MDEIEFIPLEWLERAAWYPRLMVYSRPVAVERRHTIRRVKDRTEKLLRSLFSAQS